jgi:hypothetical protein
MQDTNIKLQQMQLQQAFGKNAPKKLGAVWHFFKCLCTKPPKG